jgi:hypothetical protein
MLRFAQRTTRPFNNIRRLSFPTYDEPAPLPLGNKKDQEEFLRSVKEAQQGTGDKHQDAEKNPLKPFENGVNPDTGEVQGPK